MTTIYTEALNLRLSCPSVRMQRLCEDTHQMDRKLARYVAIQEQMLSAQLHIACTPMTDAECRRAAVKAAQAWDNLSAVRNGRMYAVILDVLATTL